MNVKSIFFTLLIMSIMMRKVCAQNPFIPYDIFIAGFDSDINNNGKDLLVLNLASTLETKSNFGISDKFFFSDTDFSTSQNSPQFVNVKYIGEASILEGEALHILIGPAGISIKKKGVDVTSLFQMTYSQGYRGDFLPHNKASVVVYGGIMVENAGDQILLGSTLDLMSYGLTESDVRSVRLPSSVAEKNFNFAASQSGTSTSFALDRKDCLLCELLLDLLNLSSWIELPSTLGNDLTAINFDFDDCVVVNCEGSLQIEDLECVELYPTSLPCTDIEYWRWSKMVGGQFQTLEEGENIPVTNFQILHTGSYQLEIRCGDGCVYTSNVHNPPCFDDPCESNIDITTDDCQISVTIDDCPEASYQWFVYTEGGLFLVAGATSSSIVAEENGTYYAEIYDCALCEDGTTPFIEMDCGPDCGCDLDVSIAECQIDVDVTGCNAYTGIFEYFLESVGEWIIISNATFPYSPDQLGNGLYRYTLSSLVCADEITQSVVIDCSEECDDCGDDPCNVLPYMSIDDCVLEAIILNCESPTIQWQAQNPDNSWTDLIGETSTTYAPVIDGTYRYEVTGCGCIGDTYYSDPYTTDCFEECACEIEYTLDDDCAISITPVDCGLIERIQWYRQTEDGMWYEMVSNQGALDLTPSQNGNYRVVITSSTCGQGSIEFSVDCVVECEFFDLALSHSTDCGILLAYEGCFNLDDIVVLFAQPSALTTEEDCVDGQYSPYSNYDTNIQLSSSFNGTGLIEIIPSDEGCYKIILNCNSICTEEDIIYWKPCCTKDVTIEYDEDGLELCDYCYVNACTDSLLDITVVINGVQTNLADITEFFNFPYCDDGTFTDHICGLSEDCGDMATFLQLRTDLNMWLQANGFDGTAHLGSGPDQCKGEATPFWIEQTNVVFVSAFLYENLHPWNNGYQVHPFLVSDCTGGSGEPTLFLTGLCEGAEILWNTGATTSNIPYVEGESYRVTVICPDGCVSELVYRGEHGAGSSTLINKSLEPISAKVPTLSMGNTVEYNHDDMYIYPNPAQTKFTVDINTKIAGIKILNIYSMDQKLQGSHSLECKSGLSSFQFSASDLISGIYILEMATTTNRIIKKLVITH